VRSMEAFPNGCPTMSAAFGANVRCKAWLLDTTCSSRFLRRLSRRMRLGGQSSARLHLRMGRHNIASYRGVVHETVSRVFNALMHMPAC
jgi:hypothetical protein